MKTVVVCLMVVVLSISLLIIPIQSAQPNNHLISSQGIITRLNWLHTDGRYIKDQYGQIVHFVGAAESQSTWRYDIHPYWKHGGDPIPMAKRMNELNVTWIRICVAYTFWSDPNVGASYKLLIDRYVREFTIRGIYCMVGCMGHEFKDPDNLQPWLNFIAELAIRYKNNPGMCGIYVYNEPPNPPFGIEMWHSMAVEAAEVIHNVNPSLLILVHGDLANQEGMDSYWLSNPINVSNVVYVFHHYFWQDYYYHHRDFAENYALGNYSLAKEQLEQSMYDRYFKYAVENDMCIMNEEFGFNDYSKLNFGEKYWNPGWSQSQIDYMDLLEKYQIPWNQYSWWVNTGESYGLAEESDYYTLSPVGKIWARYLTNGS